MYAWVLVTLLLAAGVLILLLIRLFLIPPRTAGGCRFELAIGAGSPYTAIFVARWRSTHILRAPRHPEIQQRVEALVRLRFGTFSGTPEEARELLRQLGASPQVNALGREFSIADLWLDLTQVR